MAKLLKLRRGTTSQHSSFTGAEGEVTVDTTKDTLVVHDGSTAGGHPLAKAATVATTITVADESSDTTCFPLFVTAATGDLGPKTGSNITFNSDTGLLTAVGLTLSGNLTVNGTTTTVATTNTTVTDNLLELNSGAGSNANDSGILIERGSTGDNAIIAWDESEDKFIVGTTTATNDATGNISVTTGTLVANLEGNVTATTVTDGKGNVRSIPQNTQGSTYTLVAADAGKHILASGTVTIPNSVFSAGDAVTIVNNTGGDLTITKTITTMYLATDGTSDNRTLATRGVATILFASGTVAYISGAGLS
jgi:hypothetical protein